MVEIPAMSRVPAPQSGGGVRFRPDPEVTAEDASISVRIAAGA